MKVSAVAHVLKLAVPSLKVIAILQHAPVPSQIIHAVELCGVQKHVLKWHASICHRCGHIVGDLKNKYFAHPARCMILMFE